MRILPYTSDACACDSMRGVGVYPADAVAGQVHVLGDDADFDRLGMTTNAKASRVELMYDEYISSTGITAVGMTSANLNDTFGMFDQMVVQAQVDQVTAGTGGASFECDLLHSGDGVNWVPFQALTPLIPPFSLVVTPSNVVTYVPMGYIDGTKPLLAFVRLQFTVATGTGSVSAHVKARVTCNDLREKQFARVTGAEYAREQEALPPTPEHLTKAERLLAKAWTDAYQNAEPIADRQIVDTGETRTIVYFKMALGKVVLRPIDMAPVTAAVAKCKGMYLRTSLVDQLSSAAQQAAYSAIVGRLKLTFNVPAANPNCDV